LHPVFTYLDFATTIFLKSNVVSLASNRQPGGLDLKALSFIKSEGTNKDNKNAVRIAGLFLKFQSGKSQM
jgi:hypothetical protein